MIPRLAETAIMERLKHTPAVAVLGPRQVGKTTLAREIEKKWKNEAVYLDLERLSDLMKISNPELYLKQHTGKLIIIDEIHRLPGLFKILRTVIDERRAAGEKSGQFLLLGSASLDIIQEATETLAGRLATIHLGALNVAEFDGIDSLWLRGGLPESLLAASDEESFRWREDFINSYLERDIPALGPRVPAETLWRFWSMLAHSQGQVINQSSIAGNVGVSVMTIRRYLDLLTNLLLVRPLLPWAGDIGKRLVKSPKYYIRDSGLVHALLSIPTMDDLMGHPIVGKSWEGFVVENLLAVAPQRTKPFFFETSDNMEIDLVLETSPRQRIAVAVKRSLTPALPNKFHKACDALKIKNRYIVYPGSDNYYYAEGLEAMPLKRMMAIIASKE